MADPPFGDGPYHLTTHALACNVEFNGPGTFLLGEQTEDGFLVARVGRSDTDINARLQSMVGKYRHFLFAYAPSAHAAFVQECALFHDFQPGHNPQHPQPRVGTAWACPRCEATRLQAA